MKENIDDKWIGIDAVADYLDVNKDSIRNWIKNDSGIPAHKIGKQWKFKKSDLDDWVLSGKSAFVDEKDENEV
jgi:DNA binding domain, excisionase family